MRTNKLIELTFCGVSLSIPIGTAVMDVSENRFRVTDLAWISNELFNLAMKNPIFVNEQDVDIGEL